MSTAMEYTIAGQQTAKESLCVQSACPHLLSTSWAHQDLQLLAVFWRAILRFLECIVRTLLARLHYNRMSQLSFDINFEI